MTRKKRKKYRQDIDANLTKAHTMMYSDDIEMSNLGLKMLRGVVHNYSYYKVLRGLTIHGKSFFPFKLQQQVSEWKLELLKGKITKAYLRKQIFKKQTNKNHSYENEE